MIATTFDDVAENERMTLVPVHLDVELTTRCNLSCPMCAFHGPNAIDDRQPQDMDFDLYKKIIDEFSSKGGQSVKLNFAGEPLLYKPLIEAIKYAKDKGLEVLINTNGLYLLSDICEELVKSGIDKITISDYEFLSQIDSVSRLWAVREFLDSFEPTIVVKTDNPKRFERWADEIVKPEFYDYCHLVETFDKSDFKCTQPWQRFLVLANGDVLSCSCGTILPEKFIGNIHTNSLENLWGSRQMTFLRKCHSARASELPRQCRLCPARRAYIERNAT